MLALAKLLTSHTTTDVTAWRFIWGKNHSESHKVTQVVHLSLLTHLHGEESYEEHDEKILTCFVVSEPLRVCAHLSEHVTREVS